MSSFKLEIVTPTEINEIENASYIRCPGTDGSFGIMKGHRDAVIALGVGEIKITESGNDSYYATSGGFAEISKDKVQFLLETVESSKDMRDPIPRGSPAGKIFISRCSHSCRERCSVLGKEARSIYQQR